MEDSTIAAAAATSCNNDWKSFGYTHVMYRTNDDFFHGPIMALLSLAPIFYVVAACTMLMIAKDGRYFWVILGFVGDTLVCTILKDLIQEPRPIMTTSSSNHHLDYLPTSQIHGMPSNHASSCCFAAMYCFLSSYRRASFSSSLSSSSSQQGQPSNQQESVRTSQWKILSQYPLVIKVLNCYQDYGLCLFLWLIATGCCHSRIYLQYHTPKQVYVGCLVGILNALAYRSLFLDRFLPILWTKVISTSSSSSGGLGGGTESSSESNHDWLGFALEVLEYLGYKRKSETATSSLKKDE